MRGRGTLPGITVMDILKDALSELHRNLDFNRAASRIIPQWKLLLHPDRLREWELLKESRHDDQADT